MKNLLSVLRHLYEEFILDTNKIITYQEKKENQKYETFLDDPNSKLGKLIWSFIIFLIFVSIGLLIFESIGNNAVKYKNWILIIDGFISTIFAIEYFYRFSFARNKISFIFKPMNIIDFLAWIPFFIEILLQGLIEVSYLKVLRLLRVFRIFKMFRYVKILDKIWYGIKQYSIEYMIGFLGVFIVIIISAVLMYYIEGDTNQGFQTIPDAIWWAIVTATTVGYGDVVPSTIFGKVIGSIVILIGPTVIAMVSSITVLVFMEVATAQKQQRMGIKICPRCGNEDNDFDANYCKICGEKLTK